MTDSGYLLMKKVYSSRVSVKRFSDCFLSRLEVLIF